MSESYSNTFSMFLLLESGKSKRSTEDSKVRTKHPLCSAFLFIYVYVCMYGSLFKHTHTQVHSYTHTCLMYRELPSVWRHNVGTLKQLNSEIGCCIVQHLSAEGPDSGWRGK